MIPPAIPRAKTTEATITKSKIVINGPLLMNILNEYFTFWVGRSQSGSRIQKSFKNIKKGVDLRNQRRYNKGQLREATEQAKRKERTRKMEGKAKGMATLEQLMRENDELNKKLIEREEELNEAEKARVK